MEQKDKDKIIRQAVGCHLSLLEQDPSGVLERMERNGVWEDMDVPKPTDEEWKELCDGIYEMSDMLGKLIG